MNILQDIKTAIKITGEVRKARDAGANTIQIKPIYTVPCVRLGPAYYNTIEGCQTDKMGRDIDRAIMEVFKSLPYETQRELEFTPDEPGGMGKTCPVLAAAVKACAASKDVSQRYGSFHWLVCSLPAHEKKGRNYI